MKGFLALAIWLVFTTSAGAWERRPGRAPDERSDWVASNTVEVSYYNICTGFTWNWVGPPPYTSYGVFFDDVSSGADRLLRTNLFYLRGSPAGYGYTGVAQVFPPFDISCPGIPTLATQFFLPTFGWNTVEWNGDIGIPVESFWVLVSHSGQPGNPAILVTEKGEPGGDEPGGCTRCYSPDRPRHSFQFGNEPFIVCPGGPWLDNSDCDLELLWSSDVRTSAPVSVGSASWGSIKSLYR